MVVKPSSFPLEMKNLREITNSPDKRPPSHCLDVVITKFVLDHSFPLQLLLPIFKVWHLFTSFSFGSETVFKSILHLKMSFLSKQGCLGMWLHSCICTNNSIYIIMKRILIGAHSFIYKSTSWHKELPSERILSNSHLASSHLMSLAGRRKECFGNFLISFDLC